MSFGLMVPLQINNFTLTSSLGLGVAANWQKIADMVSGLAPCNFYDIQDLETWVGEISALDEVVLGGRWKDYDCRNNRLALLALQQDDFIEGVNRLISAYGETRVGLFLGTSTSGIHQTEKAYLGVDVENELLPDWYNYQYTHDAYSVVDFVSQYLGLYGPSIAVSTACSSSAKVFASAYRSIASGLCDAAVVGGIDSLCLTTLYGFNSLQLLGKSICQPFDIDRPGISIGEAGGFALLERRVDADAEFLMLGYGESSDAYHMSSPHPDGNGAYAAMLSALDRARLRPEQIDYINLHGTGTVANDLAESRAIVRLFGSGTPCSSTKGWTGHTLGAAGIVEVIFSLLTLRHQMLPACLNTRTLDPLIKSNILLDSVLKPSHHVLTNSFGFGGSNCSLIFGKNA